MPSAARSSATLEAALAVVAIGATTAVLRLGLHQTNPTTVALTFLLVVLVVAATSRLWVAVLTSVVAMACFNFFFLPPVGTLTIADPQNWVALFAFLAVSLVASNLSSAARGRAREATERRDEMTRLFDLSRDVLVLTDSPEVVAGLARIIARRFDLDYAAVCLPRGDDWEIAEGGPLSIALDRQELRKVFAGASGALEFDAKQRTYSGHQTATIGDHLVHLVPLRLGTKPVGLLAASGRPVEPGTLDALAGVAAIAIERVQFLNERKSAEIARKSEELKSALLASLGHDLRTPLTAIRVAAGNLRGSWVTEDDRRDQSDLILAEVERLTRLFQNILDMARIDAGAIATEARWAHPSEIIAAARDQVEHTLRHHTVNVAVDPDVPVRLDPRLTATAVAHLLENAAQYAPAGSSIEVSARATAEGLVVTVRDHGPGIAPADLPHLFERFFRGATARSRQAGTGMGLSIARGLLAVEQGRVWAENCPDGGAQFSIVVPAATKEPEAAASPTT